MGHLVFARKFRPQSFDDVVAQKHIVKAIRNAVIKGRVGHAYLLTGPRGVGKTTMARIFAKALNCQNPAENAEPCGKCANCEEITNSRSLGVWEIDGASNNSVENIRSLIDSLKTLPPEGYNYKVYIVDEVHMLSTAAFNALLKSLEEPPPNTVFVFATTEPQKIPETVISRCQRFDFRQISNSDIAQYLTEISQKEGFELGADAAGFIARKSGGALRDALSMLERLTAFSDDKLLDKQVYEVFSSIDPNFFYELSELVLEQKPKEAVEKVMEAFCLGPDVKTFLHDFLSHFRHLMLVKLGVQEDERAISALGNTSNFDIQRLYNMADDICSNALRSLSPEYLLEAGVARMASQAKARDISELLSGGYVTSVASVSVGVKETSRAVSKEPTVATTKETPASFTPNWESFLSHVREAKRPILLSHLQRGAPAEFSAGKLVLKVPSSDTLEVDLLKSELSNYSGQRRWDVQIIEEKQTKTIEGSVVAKTKAKKEKIIDEARQQDVVQSALDAFSGSKIEKVII